MIFMWQMSSLKGNEELTVVWSLSNMEENTRSWGPICSNELAICVCMCVHVSVIVRVSVSRALFSFFFTVCTGGHVCVRPKANQGCPCSTVWIRGKLRRCLAQQGVMCISVGVGECLSICTFHPSQQPHMSTPHHIPGGTAAISVTKEPTNSFITQSTRAVMAPWAKLPQHNQELWKCCNEQSSLTFTENIL